MSYNLSVIGLGKLGACTAACFALRGFDVIGIDVNPESVKAINAGHAPVWEPMLSETIQKTKSKLTATLDFAEAIKKTDVSFLIVPTPSQTDGHFSTRYLREALTKLASLLSESSKKYHLFVITSTVSPKSIEKDLIPLIEKYSGRKLNEGFGVAYNPEFIALGSVIRDFLNPDMILIGESAPSVGDTLEFIYKKTCDNEPKISRMSLVSAEIAKLSLNAYITMKISFVNSLSNICQAIPNANIDNVTEALGADRRIAPYYLKGGVGYGGPCFPRDNKAFVAFAAEQGVDAKLARAVEKINDEQIYLLYHLILSHMNSQNNTLAILGVAYKANTPVIENSPAVKLIEFFLKHPEYNVIVYDALATNNIKDCFKEQIQYASSIEECFLKANVVLIMTEDPAFKEIDQRYFSNKSIVIIDCWRVLQAHRFDHQKINYIGLGRWNSNFRSMEHDCIS
ncbi:MAG: hypothetical protein A3I12_06755 [Gammaproteobacteria bacterium RIFCSPLOWO2_02_FULL_38_11]|nr:MAG: hypothetical protein A3B69_00130 [Gammaproteobacteria bacterium RIFCSPHIGHO2_02_FULL_38_33]OGT24486.1 MAG: hypothetical protein A2W47_06320 [Gammaproteobacteria bacterium RIFCSPHIGHO2_12_38_15]OGT67912.1 MAG: hypothetical protein A3I12_06755 [Gammaproteobacteria bacterium RIFCSPLOWO2_02_FULL_38_11]OGT77005.1 MAG: hypothetical protein A3G71_01385 [Gammaproteobacteria bacterium RIFCSPLOWO2_12_FULL_38_14]